MFEAAVGWLSLGVFISFHYMMYAAIGRGWLN